LINPNKWLPPDGTEHFIHHDVGKSDHGVERRTQFVADIGEEFGLGPIGGLGRFLGRLKIVACHLGLGDVARYEQRRGPPLPGHRDGGYRGPERRPVEPLETLFDGRRGPTGGGRFLKRPERVIVLRQQMVSHVTANQHFRSLRT
jgi:hypothetical protein